MASLEGQWLGRRHILRRIGGGGMGEVYLAEEPHLNRQVAVKVIGGLGDDAAGATPETTLARRQFAQEARAVAALDHPNILALYDYGEQDDIHFLVMPYVKDGSLADLLNRDPQRRFTPPLPPSLVAQIIGQCADALQYAHDRGIIHRDVKPQNLLVRLGFADVGVVAPSLHILLADFGVARFQEEQSSQTGATGTPLYSAPEQFAGRPDYASDQYALACVAYLLLTGQPIFRGSIVELYHQHLSVAPTPPTRVNPTLPLAVDAVMARALAKRPADRFPRVEQFGEALASAVRGDALQWAAASAAGAGQAPPLLAPTLPAPPPPANMSAPPVAPPVAPSALITPIGAADPTTRSFAAPQAPADAAAHQLSLTEIDPERVLSDPSTVPDTAHQADAGRALPPSAPVAPRMGLPAARVEDALTQPVPAKRSGGARPNGARGRAQQALLLALAVAIVLAALAGVGAANGGLAALLRLGATVDRATATATATDLPTATELPTATATPTLYTPPGFTRVAGQTFSVAFPATWLMYNGVLPGSTNANLSEAQVSVNTSYPLAQVLESASLGATGDVEGLFQQLRGDINPLGPEGLITIGGVSWRQRAEESGTPAGDVSQVYIVCIHNGVGYVIHFVSLTVEYTSDYTAYYHPVLLSFAFNS